MVNQLFEQFVENHLNEDTKILALRAKNLDGLDKSGAITQIALLQKAAKKIPTFFGKRCLLTQKSYEQATSERVAKFKANLFSGDLFLDLTGGLGVDDFFFSQTFSQVFSLDPDAELNKLVRYNNTKLGALNIERIDSTAEDYLGAAKNQFDLIYADPDRRDSAMQRKIHVKDWQPNIIGLLPTIFEYTNTFVLKLSPLFDLDELFKLFPNTAKLYIISELGEVKELLAVMKNEECNNPQVLAVSLNQDSELVYNSSGDMHSYLESKQLSGMFLYEFGNALVKSKLWQAYATQLHIDILEKHTPIALSDNLIQPCMGRVFRLVEQVPYKNREIEMYLSKWQMKQANISRHNFKENVEQLRKRWKIKEGGTDYLFFATNRDGAYMYHAVKIDVVNI